MKKELFDILDEELEDELAFAHRQKVVTRITGRIMEWLDSYIDLEEIDDFGGESSSELFIYSPSQDSLTSDMNNDI